MLFALSLALGACGGKVVVDTGTIGDLTCAEVCMKFASGCAGMMTQSCAMGCATSDKVGTACPASYQAYLACADAHSSAPCDGATACSAEATAFGQCLTKVCSADPAKCMP